MPMSVVRVQTTTARSNAAPTQNIEFNIYMQEYYTFAQVDGLTIASSHSNPVAFERAAEMERDSAINKISSRQHMQLFGGGEGALGQISSDADTSTTTLKLKYREDHCNFAKNDKVVFAQTQTGSVRSATALTVTAVDGDAGELTLSATPDSLSASIAAGDYIFFEKDAADGGSVVLPTGLNGWIPRTAPTSGDSFHGVDRSVDVNGLAGWRLDKSSVTVEEALYDGWARSYEMGARPDLIVMHPVQFAALQKTLTSNITVVPGKEFGVGYPVVRVLVGGVNAEVIVDQRCPVDTMFILDTATFKWYYVGDSALGHVWDLDGSKADRSTSRDAVELQVVYYGNIGCKAPKWNGRVTLQATAR